MRLAAIFLMLAASVLGGCTVTSTHSSRMTPDVVKVSSVRVVFDLTRPPFARVNTTMSGYNLELARIKNLSDQQVARSLGEQLVQIFAAGFRDRFPTLAARYGLTVSASAEMELRLQDVGELTRCTQGQNCFTRITINAQLLDAAGKPVWRFDTTVGQATQFAKISDEIFDALAEEVLGAMKSDGVISASGAK